ncbi:acyl dehydratase [Litorivivens lipolytica]|uniref:Acyl dehydratase n=1 Tax=Litorivivens lipolytica TaxID=1524264 RepID=A0A7W4W407_9GAMM|nr:MaoC/PaaZ C-terminal domain-containing protein [Litorivivens lipolytica]MBB3047046.1 acyl dehydratase [Litorivivens lipolytica]
MRYFEDIVVGQRVKGTDTYTLTAEEIKTYAAQWDPLPFHTDEEAARQSPIGKLFASSIHTVALGVKLSHAIKQDAMAVIAGLGWDEVRFHLPVCADDTLRVEAEICSKRESISKPDRGICVTLIELYNQHDQLAVEYKIASLVMKREA